MPELPAVEFARLVAERQATGRRIERAYVARDPIVFEGVSAARWRRALEGRRVEAAHRRGKHLWLELDRRPWPLVHLGMTGAVRVPERAPLRLISSGTTPDVAWPPRFTKLRLAFDDGGELAVTSMRRLGGLRLREDPLREPPLARLGFDPLLDLPPARELATRIGGRSITLKGLLLDQSFAAGVGNWMADEILYQARLDPRRPASSLTGDEVKRLRTHLGAVTRRAVAVEGLSERFPRTWLYHVRWRRPEGAQTVRGEPIAVPDARRPHDGLGPEPCSASGSLPGRPELSERPERPPGFPRGAHVVCLPPPPAGARRCRDARGPLRPLLRRRPRARGGTGDGARPRATRARGRLPGGPDLLRPARPERGPLRRRGRAREAARSTSSPRGRRTRSSRRRDRASRPCASQGPDAPRTRPRASSNGSTSSPSS